MNRPWILRAGSVLGFALLAPAANALTPLSGVASLGAGSNHTCAVTTGGGVKCWGNNDNGRLGDNSLAHRLTPVGVAGLASGVAAVAAGGSHSCAVTLGGGAKCWGYNGSGQLGDESTTQRLAPVDVAGLASGVAAVAAGASHTCALATGGGVKCWGSNAAGQLGDDSTVPRPSPVDVAGLASGVAAITLGGSHSCALASTGGVKCWGDNAYGQLGDGTTTQRSAPVDVEGLAGGVVAISAGHQHTCALTAGGGVKCWGDNAYGQLGDNSTTQRPAPVDVAGLANGVAGVSAGGLHTCARTTGGGAKCWGYNEYGQLGDDSHASRLAPVDVTGLASGVAAVVARGVRSCALVATGGVKCWGANYYGELGDNSTTHRRAPVDAAGLGSGAAALGAGSFHACALTTGGGVKCWGRNDVGQIGDGSTADRLQAVDAAGLASGVQAISAGYGHTCSLGTGGGVKCWGANAFGQLGDGTTTQRLAPVDVAELAGGVTAIAAGHHHTCALTSSGGVKCWGRNASGQLGDGSTVPRSAPADVAGLAGGIAAIAAGYAHTCALDSVGGVKCWGDNDGGQLGDNSTLDRLAPVDVTGLANGVTAIATGRYHSCAVTAGGSAMCWGYNAWGQLGDGSIESRLAPGNVAGLASGVADVAAADSHTCARTTGGGVKCWGYNFTGQVGDGTAGQRAYPDWVLVDSPMLSLLSEFNGDARSDVFWRDATGGLNYQWQMNGLAISGQGYMPSVPTNWAVAGIGDVNGNGIADVLWRETGGLNYLWTMNGLAIASQGYLPTVANPWIVVGLGDANGDGRADVFWRNPTTGQNYLWVMNGISITSQGYLPSVAGPDWEAVGVADYSGDGKADVFWRNKTTGQNYLWVMNGLVVSSQGFLTTIASTDWEVVGSPDANADAKADVFWRNKVTGQNYLWVMNGLAIASQGYLPSVADANWKVAGYGDYNGDGRGDVLWRHATTGQNYLWTLNGISVATQGFLPSVAGANWAPIKR